MATIGDRIELPGGATLDTQRGEEGFYWLNLPNGVTVYAGIRNDSEGFPELVGATYVAVVTEDVPAANHPNGDPRVQVCLNAATLYDEEASR